MPISETCGNLGSYCEGAWRMLATGTPVTGMAGATWQFTVSHTLVQVTTGMARQR